MIPKSYSYQNQFMTFADAEKICVKQGYDIGFALKGSGICGVDLDHVRDPETGEVEKWAQKMIEWFDSFTEISVSGSGFHILVRADVGRKILDTYNIIGMQGRKMIYSSPEEHEKIAPSDRKHIEFYADDKYFTISGKTYLDRPIRDCQEKVGEFISVIRWKNDWKERAGEQAKAEQNSDLKTHISDYMQLVGADRDPKAGKNKYICPICKSGTKDHEGATGAFTLYPRTNTFYCFSCHVGGDLFTLIENVEKVDFKGALARAVELYRPDQGQTDSGSGSPIEAVPTPNVKEMREQEFLDRIKSEESVLTFDKMLTCFEKETGEYIKFDQFPAFSKALNLKKHDSLVLGADTGFGKSSLALNWIHSLSKDYPIIYFNLEMSDIIVYKRLVGIHTKMEINLLDSYKNMTPELMSQVKQATKEITSGKPIRIFDDIRGIDKIRTICHELSQEEHTIVVIDHMLLTEMEGSKNRYEKFTDISEELRKIAKDENITMILLCQLNREGKKNNKEPDLSALKESGSIENDATQVVFLWGNDEHPLRIMIRKNRGGENGGDFYINYDLKSQFMKEDPACNAEWDKDKTKDKGSKKEKKGISVNMDELSD